MVCRRVMLLILLIGVWGAHPAKADEALTAVTLQLRWHHQFQFAGYYAAKQQGFYREAGFDVTILNGRPGREPVSEVLAGRAQFGVANGELLHQRLKGQPLVALAAIFQHSASVLVSKQSAGIRTPHDLIGRKVMLISQGADVGLVAMLENEGVDISRIDVIKSSYDINDLIEDRVDAFNSYLTNEPYYLAQRQIPISVIHPASYGVDFYSDILFTTEAALGAMPDGVRRFREASLRGWEYAMAHPEEVIELIIAEYNDAKSREHLRYEAERMRSLILPELIEMGHMNPGRWAHMADTFVAQGMALPGYDLSGFIFDADPRVDLDQWRRMVGGLGGSLMLLVAVALVLWFYNRRLRAAIDYGRQVQNKLRNQTARFEAIFQSTPDATVIGDLERNIIMCNPAFGQIFGYRPEEVIGRSSGILYMRSEDFNEQGELRFYPGAKTRLLPYELDYRRKGGEPFPGQSMGGPIINKDNDTIGYILVVRDVTEQKKSEQAIVRMALTDSLTGLANRHQFNITLQEQIKRSARQPLRFSLLLMDLDLFKEVNDHYGHPAGDELLRRVGLALRGIFRETDLIARIGGDEFAVLMLDQASPQDIRQLGERVINSLAQPTVIDGHSVQVGVSIGAATFPADSTDEAALYRMADRALYASKEQGRNRLTLACEALAVDTES